MTAESLAEFGGPEGGGLGISPGIAGRYAKALYELAVEQNQRDQVASDLGQIKALLAESPDLVRLIKSPAYSRDEQGRALKAVLGRAGVGDLTQRFIGLTARNRRVFALPAMIDAYVAMVARAKGEVTATVTSAQPLSEAQLSQIRDQLAAKAKRNVSLSASVDPSLIGGLVVKMGSRMIDSSLKTKLQSLELAMKGVG